MGCWREQNSKYFKETKKEDKDEREERERFKKEGGEKKGKEREGRQEAEFRPPPQCDSSIRMAMTE